MYNVKLEKFEGPLELLLELIEKEQLKITELSLAHVADQYLDYIKNHDSIALENLADFLTIASRLILIKSRALLPMLQVTPEEEEEIQDLAKQLEEYKKFREASQKIGPKRHGFKTEATGEPR
jgi:segregation and condensation protein A